MIFSILANVLLPVFVVAAISAVAQRQLRLDVQSFSKAAFYVFSPAMVIDALATEFDTDVPFAALAILVTTLASIITVTGWLFWLM